MRHLRSALDCRIRTAPQPANGSNFCEDMSRTVNGLKGRSFFADGRIEDDVTVDDRVTRYPIRDGGELRWFVKTTPWSLTA